MKIRVAIQADIETLFAIRTAVRENHQSRAELATIGVTPEAVSEMLRTTSRAWLVEVDGQLVAFAMADAQQGTVFALFVLPAYEGQGLGRLLLQEAEQWLYAQGCAEIWLLTGSEPGLRAHGFYQYLGWSVQGVGADGQIKYVKRG